MYNNTFKHACAKQQAWTAHTAVGHLILRQATMTEADLYIQLTVMAIVLPLLHFAWKFGKELLSEFSMLWTSDPKAKDFSLLQLVLALLATNQFKDSGKMTRKAINKTFVLIVLLITSIYMARILIPIVKDELNNRDISTNILMTEEHLEKSKLENQIKRIISSGGEK